MKIRDMEFDFNPLNASHIERLEEAQRLANQKDAMLKAELGESPGMAQVIRVQCQVLRYFVDLVLGEGAADSLGMDRDDLSACMDAFADMNKAIDERKALYGMFRASRTNAL